MSQNLVSLIYSAADLAEIDSAFVILKRQFDRLPELSIDERRSLTKMGEKTESICRQTLLLLAENADSLPARFDLAEAQRDLAVYDLLRPRFAILRALASKADDAEMALGSDILSAALEGYAIIKAFARGVGFDALREAMATRFGKRRKAKPAQ